MTKHKILTALFCLALLGGLWSCAKVVKNESPIRTAIKITASDVTATAATISLNPATAPDASEVASYLVAGPAKADKMPYAEWNPIQCLDYITATGMIENAPYKKTFTGLEQGSTYAIGVVSQNQKGEICSAPTFFTFSTGAITTDCFINCESEDAPFVYNYTVTPNQYANKVQYIVSTDPAVTKLDDMGLLLKVTESGSFATSAVSGKFEETTKKDAVVAAVAYDENDEQILTSFSFYNFSAKASVSVNVNGTKTNLQQPKEDVLYFTGDIAMPTAGEFTFIINNIPYGWIPYSGNGGIGTITNDNSCVPYYNIKTLTTNFKFEAEKSVGQMKPIADGGLPFWLNRKESYKVQVVVDQTYGDGIPRYYIKELNTDANRVFYEGFDLFVWGGFYPAAIMGSANSTFGGEVNYPDIIKVDGTEPGTPNVIKNTANGTKPFTYGTPITDTSKEGAVNETYMKNRDMQGWTLKRIVECAGHLQLGNSQNSWFETYILSPKIGKLTAATDVIVNTEAFRFAGDGDINLAVLNAGTITKVVVKQISGACSSGEVVGEGEFSPTTPTEFTITKDILPKIANASTEKNIAKISLYVTGATKDTQIKFYQPEGTIASNGRIQFNYIEVVKQ